MSSGVCIAHKFRRFDRQLKLSGFLLKTKCEPYKEFKFIFWGRADRHQAVRYYVLAIAAHIPLPSFVRVYLNR